jgi:hypothetical protein
MVPEVPLAQDLNNSAFFHILSFIKDAFKHFCHLNETNLIFWVS